MLSLNRKHQLVLLAIILLLLSTILAFINGQVAWSNQVSAGTLSIGYSPVIYTGFKSTVAKGFGFVFNLLMVLFNKSILLSVLALAALVELALLYPAIRLQLKQKKIHLLHKKLIDRFRKNIITASATQDELHRLYSVNEQIHRRGALYVFFQFALFFVTFWGLNLIVRSPHLMKNSWSLLNFSLLSKPTTHWIVLMAAAAYLLHVLIKMHYKQKEDYLDPVQVGTAFVITILGTIAVYTFGQHFSVAMILYFVALITFSTVRYIVVEQHAQKWNKLVHQELVQMLRSSAAHNNRFQYFSRLWNHLPIVRHINFNLLEEALSMTLGLLLVLTFLGAFGAVNGEINAAQIQANLLYLEVTHLFN